MQDVVDAITERWPERMIQIEHGSITGYGDSDSVVDAIRLQALGLTVVAAVIAMASLVFVGQAVARQVRLEWRDAPTLTALGMSRSSMTLTAAVRSLPLMIVDVSLAAIVSIAMSPLGPIGVARAAETEPGVAIDWTVLAVGLPAVAVCVLLFAIVPVAASHRRRTTRPLSDVDARWPFAPSDRGSLDWR